jgi:hypothetical protein
LYLSWHCSKSSLHRMNSLCMQYCRVLFVHGRVRHHLLPLLEPGLGRVWLVFVKV